MPLTTTESLDSLGFAVLDGVLSPSKCDELGSILDEIERERRAAGKYIYDDGRQVVLYALHVDRPKTFIPLIEIPRILDVAKTVLADRVTLSSINASRTAKSGPTRVHIDTRVPCRDYANTTNLIAMLCIDDFTATNGPFTNWPTSHKSGTKPPALQPHEIPGRHECLAPKGSAVLFVGQLWHCIGESNGEARRWGVIANYQRWWLKPNFDHTRCGPEIYRMLTPTQKELFGFTSQPPRDADKRLLTVTPLEQLPNVYEESLQS